MNKREDIASLVGKATKSARVSASKSDNVSDSETPKYQTLHAKQARFTPAQLDRLNDISRRLNKARVDKDERITPNTLIRVGVEILFLLEEHLAGDNEDDLVHAMAAAIGQLS